MRKIIAAFAVLVIVAVIAGYFSLNSLLASAIRTYGSSILGTEVSLDSSSISIFSGTGELNELTIANPEGFSDRNALEVESIKVALDVTSLLTDKVVVEQVLVQGPVVTYETGSRGSNLDALLKNAKRGGEKAEKPGDGGGGESGGPSKDVVIGLLAIRDGKINLALTEAGGKGASLALPDIERTNIGRDTGGTSLAEVFEIFLFELQKAVVKGAGGAGEFIKENVEKIGKGLKDLFQ